MRADIEFNAIKLNLGKAQFYSKMDKPVNLIYFCKIDEDIPAVSMIGNFEILIPAIASIIHNTATQLNNGNPSKKADEALLMTVRLALADIYGGQHEEN